jgi:hypothetical protein
MHIVQRMHDIGSDVPDQEPSMSTVRRLVDENGLGSTSRRERKGGRP